MLDGHHLSVHASLGRPVATAAADTWRHPPNCPILFNYRGKRMHPHLCSVVLEMRLQNLLLDARMQVL